MIGFFNFWKLEHLSAQRHPMYESHRRAQQLTRFWGLLGAGYVVLIGVQLAHYIMDMVPLGEPYLVLMGTLLLVVGAVDFWMRFAFQPPPTHRMRPYLLLPIPRRKLLTYLLIRTVLHPFNLYSWCFCLPLAILSLYPLLGMHATAYFLAACIGLLVLNNESYLLCRNLLARKTAWILLPLALQGSVVLAFFLAEKETADCLGKVLQAFINGSPAAWLPLGLLILTGWKLNERLLLQRIYEEESNDYHPTRLQGYGKNRQLFARWGAVGRYMDLEVQLLLRNRFCRNQLRNIGLLLVVFAVLYTVTPVYEKGWMAVFIPYYLLSALGITLLSRLLTFEGNYLDGWMVRQESLWLLLKAKYVFYVLLEAIPMLLLLPALLLGKGSPTTALAFGCINIGYNYFFFFLLAAHRSETTPLNTGISKRPTGPASRLMVVLGTLVLPLGLYNALSIAVGPTTADWIFTGVGLAFTAAAPYWLKLAYRQWMKKKYERLEGYRNSRE